MLKINFYLNQVRQVRITNFFHFNDLRYRHVFTFGYFEIAELNCLIELVNFLLKQLAIY